MIVKLLDDHVADGGLPGSRTPTNPDEEGLPRGGGGGSRFGGKDLGSPGGGRGGRGGGGGEAE